MGFFGAAQKIYFCIFREKHRLNIFFGNGHKRIWSESKDITSPLVKYFKRKKN